MLSGFKDMDIKNNSLPRVTQIISSMTHDDSLIKWANNLGLYQNKNSNNVRLKGATIDFLSKNLINDYLQNGNYDINKYNIKDYTILNKSINITESFIKWFKYINEHKTVTILDKNVDITMNVFHGICDLLLDIDDKIYLITYKSVNKISYKHYLEISAYRYMLKKLYNVSINGCMILQLNKHNISYEEYLLDLCNDKNNLFMNNCEKTYLSLVFSYMNRIKIENDFSTILKENEN